MRSKLKRFATGVVSFVAVMTVLHFPFSVDGPKIPTELIHDADSFYEAAYTSTEDGADSKYVNTAQKAGHLEDIEPRLRKFVAEHHLQSARALEVGAGSGTLQDVVDDYTGLDIASSAARFFHKPFVHGSATDLPFEDDSFDVVWSIWTLEHVPNPERAFAEMRRVVGNGGRLFLYPAWNNPTWAPKGYPVRPDNTLTATEIVAKYSLLIREADWFKTAHRIPARALRKLASMTGRTQLRYHTMEGNFDTYWMPDSDAINSIDCYEAALWHQTRGDEVTVLGKDAGGVFGGCGPVVVRVVK